MIYSTKLIFFQDIVQALRAVGKKLRGRKLLTDVKTFSTPISKNAKIKS